MKGMKELHQRMAADVKFRDQMAALARENPAIEQMVEALKDLGYDISDADLTGCASCGGCELGEEELENISGGDVQQPYSTQNRWDPGECSKITEVAYRCVGFLAMCYCDHYRRSASIYTYHSCAMGRFSYQE